MGGADRTAQRRWHGHASVVGRTTRACFAIKRHPRVSAIAPTGHIHCFFDKKSAGLEPITTAKIGYAPILVRTTRRNADKFERSMQSCKSVSAQAQSGVYTSEPETYWT